MLKHSTGIGRTHLYGLVKQDTWPQWPLSPSVQCLSCALSVFGWYGEGAVLPQKSDLSPWDHQPSTNLKELANCAWERKGVTIRIWNHVELSWWDGTDVTFSTYSLLTRAYTPHLINAKFGTDIQILRWSNFLVIGQMISGVTWIDALILDAVYSYAVHCLCVDEPLLKLEDSSRWKGSRTSSLRKDVCRGSYIWVM